ncbi:DUF447 domain-containing protein [Roseomonas genomospecies 6]|uniref:DUF447 family protein n=1 Tax=Roseomonas genomospecies 6 TaxID=214106 RepID=A0A9W7KQB9_9PROT|nr:DUF447 domain-containing protein [Roseomonas genomospecies 6]KAA0676898.1 DUF447 family protein [Roseomonas genomospecies 6]
MTFIRETIVTSCDAAGNVHVAPMGATVTETGYVLAPFRPSRTLDNLLATRCAVVNFTDDVRVFAGCVTGRRRDWPTVPAERIRGSVLAGALAHEEVEVVVVEDDGLRPRLDCRPVHLVTHQPFRGFNRAQAAVVEGAILVSRLHLLPPGKIDREMEYLSIAIGKTAGPVEREAWGWLLDRIAEHRAREHRADGGSAS